MDCAQRGLECGAERVPWKSGTWVSLSPRLFWESWGCIREVRKLFILRNTEVGDCGWAGGTRLGLGGGDRARARREGPGQGHVKVESSDEVSDSCEECGRSPVETGVSCPEYLQSCHVGYGECERNSVCRGR